MVMVRRLRDANMLYARGKKRGFDCVPREKRKNPHEREHGVLPTCTPLAISKEMGILQPEALVKLWVVELGEPAIN
jgi:hypothetical protein